MIRLRPLAANIIAWTAGAATAVAVGLIALSQVDGGLTESGVQPITQQAADQVSPTLTPTPGGSTSQPGPANTSTTTGAPGGTSKVVTTAGGTAAGRCQGSHAYLVYWIPAQGYKVEDVVRGPAELVQVKFEGQNREVKISFTCPDGSPRSKIEDEPHTTEH